jgi:hypothetical protein
MKIWLFSFLMVLGLTGCKDSQSSRTGTVTTNPDEMEGKTITIQGKAENSKAGAMAGKYYVDDLHSWPEEVHGKTVEVTGRLKLVEHKEEDLYDKEGNVSQGMVGTQHILLNPKWKVVE